MKKHKPERNKKRRSTSTSSFGTRGRISHDSSEFYRARMYMDIHDPNTSNYIENLIPGKQLNQIYCQSATNMTQLPDSCTHLMVTSPPYNVGKEYDQDLTLAEYTNTLKQVWREIYRVMVPGGRICINIANLGRKPYIPLHAFIIRDMIEVGFSMRGEIIWNKASSAGSSTAWGSWMSPSNPTLRDVHEYILVFSKGSSKRHKPDQRKPTINREEFLEYSKSVWTFPAVSARKIGHPAPFPVELPRRLIKFYTFEKEVVLDPFIGSGQVALAAIETNRHYIGYEINPQYVKLANSRISKFNSDPNNSSD
ncbi:MAG: DNA-methyltransferase [Anaerolineales bacterium]|jgi:site-specific DNA-methyltransferase (adenine-specific)